MTFICYPKCTTCQKAQKWLDENGILMHSETSKWKIPLMRSCLRGTGAAGCRSRNSSTQVASSINPWR